MSKVSHIGRLASYLKNLVTRRIGVALKMCLKKLWLACATDDVPIIENFFEAEITVKQGRATRKISDYFLSKRACRYIAMQGQRSFT